MNASLLKITEAVVSVVLVFLLLVLFTSSCSDEPEQSEQTELTEQTEQSTETFYDQVEEDRERFLTEPLPVEPQIPETTIPVEVNLAPQQVQSSEEPPEPATLTTLYFKELDEIEQIEAERLLSAAVPGRSIGRLPMTAYNLMVQACRQIIQKWPDSWYAYRAKQMLADMPEQERQTYNITEQEMDISIYTEPRIGTQPYTVQE